MMMNEKVLINSDLTLRQAINRLNKTALQILVVVNHQKHILGVVTDGDIRRAIIKGVSLDEKVEKAMNKNPKFLRVGFDEKEARQMFLKHGEYFSSMMRGFHREREEGHMQLLAVFVNKYLKAFAIG